MEETHRDLGGDTIGKRLTLFPWVQPLRDGTLTGWYLQLPTPPGGIHGRGDWTTSLSGSEPVSPLRAGLPRRALDARTKP